jgi:hypothetical protein
MMPLKSRRTQQIEAFEAIIPVWQETRFASGGLDAMNYSRNEGGSASNTACSSVVRPSKSDFVCDVEISARRSLSEKQLAYFNSYYRDGYGQLTEVSAECALLDLETREVLGARLLRVGIYPKGRYFRTTDVRGLACG